MGSRAVIADLLTDLLFDERADQPRTQKKRNRQRHERRHRRAKSNVAKYVEGRVACVQRKEKIVQQIYAPDTRPLSCARTFSIFIPRDPLNSSQSPFRTRCRIWAARSLWSRPTVIVPARMPARSAPFLTSFACSPRR